MKSKTLLMNTKIHHQMQRLGIKSTNPSIHFLLVSILEEAADTTEITQPSRLEKQSKVTNVRYGKLVHSDYGDQKMQSNFKPLTLLSISLLPTRSFIKSSHRQIQLLNPKTQEIWYYLRSICAICIQNMFLEY